MAHGRYLSDVLSGYRAFTLESIRQMHLREAGFEIETEMAVQAMKKTSRLRLFLSATESEKGQKRN